MTFWHTFGHSFFNVILDPSLDLFFMIWNAAAWVPSTLQQRSMAVLFATVLLLETFLVETSTRSASRAVGAALRAAFGGGQRFALPWDAFGAP